MTASTAKVDWRADADARIGRIRKSDYVVTVTSGNGQPLRDTAVVIRQTRSAFHFGTCVTFGPVAGSPNEQRYREFIVEHFNTIVSENAMKWYAVEPRCNQVSFGRADADMAFAREYNLAMRGHCLFWSKQKFVQTWAQHLTAPSLRAAMEDRLTSIVPRYRDQLIAWDVNNEMLDGSFYKDRLGDDIRAWMFKRTHELDPDVPLFVNEYGILGSPEKTARYIRLIKSLQKQGAPIGGIGIQEHACQRFAVPDRGAAGGDFPDRSEVSHAALTPEAMLQSLDQLAKLKLPIHLTEISSNSKHADWRGESLEMLFRLGYSHPQVECILLWGFWARRHWLGPDAALVETNWELNPAGHRLRKLLLEEWRTNIAARTDGEGRIRFRGFHGDYLFAVTDANGKTRQGLICLNQTAPKTAVVVRP
jgi:GH35 family endo-1,4-beta-xylanase